MKTLTFIILFILSALVARADNDLTITSGIEQSITNDGTYLLKGTESNTITLNKGITVTIKLENDVTVSGNIIVPENSSLTIEGNNHILTVSENIGGMNGKNNTIHSGEINIQSININAKNIGGGNGSYGGDGDWGGGDGGNGGSCKQISINNSVLNIEQIGGGRGGNGGNGGRHPGGEGGNGGNCTGNITIINSTINTIISIGEGKKGIGGAGRWGWDQASDGIDGKMENGSTIVPTNSLLKIDKEASVTGTYTFSEDFIIDNLTIEPSSNITINNNKQVYINETLIADNTVTVNNNLILGPQATVDGNFTNFSYAINILFKKDNSNWDDVNKTITLKFNSTNQEASFIQDNNKYSAIFKIDKFEKNETYNIFIGDLDINQSISKSSREITLDYYSLNFNTKINDVFIPTQYLLKDIEHPTRPTEDLTKQYNTFEGWSNSSYSNTNIEFSSVTISQSTTYYAIWKKNEFTVKSPTKLELTYKQTMEAYDLSELLENYDVEKCGKITYQTYWLPVDLDANTGIISGTPNETEDDTFYISLIAENGYTRTIEVQISIAPVDLTVTPQSNQIVYADDEILYDVSIPDTGEEPKFEGTLKAYNGIIIQGDLKLTGEFAKNYSIVFTPNIKISAYAVNAEDAEATLQATAGYENWSTSDITITPPADFQIALDPSTSPVSFRNGLEYIDKLDWTTEGKHTIKYSLKRNGTGETYNHDISVQLDKTAPTLTYTTDKLSYTLTFDDGVAGSGIDKLSINGGDVSLGLNATTYTATATAGTYKAKVTDKAGLSTEVEFMLKDGTSVDPDPVPEPDPDLVYYDVTLPETAGIIFSPEAGKHSVVEYGRFRFSITIAEGYREQSVPVVKANGTVITLDANGQYTLTWIQSDQSITVEGIVADIPTANEIVSPAVFELRTDGHTLCITIPQTSLCRLVDTSGRLVCNRQLSPGINRIEGLAAGVYFVVIEGKGVRKVVVR